MKNSLHRCDINRPKLGLDMDTNILNIKSISCIKQLLSNVWSSIHEKVT